MRPTPFSDFFPESYRMLINPFSNINTMSDSMKEKYRLNDSFYFVEYAKIKSNTARNYQVMEEISQMDFDNPPLPSCK